MALVKWSPTREIERIERGMEKLFSDFFEPFALGRRHLFRSGNGRNGVMVPNIDIYEKKDEFVVKAELPGVDKKDIDLTISHDNLTLKGEIKKEKEVKEEDYYACERSYGTFKRTIPLPHEIDSEKAKADYKNGVLEVILPKKEGAKAKEIKLKVS